MKEIFDTTPKTPQERKSLTGPPKPLTQANVTQAKQTPQRAFTNTAYILY